MIETLRIDRELQTLVVARIVTGRHTFKLRGLKGVYGL